MRAFWDARAREDAFYLVDNRLRYRDPDLDELWAGGQEVMDILCGEFGVVVEASDPAIHRPRTPLHRRLRGSAVLSVLLRKAPEAPGEQL